MEGLFELEITPPNSWETNCQMVVGRTNEVTIFRSNDVVVGELTGDSK